MQIRKAAIGIIILSLLAGCGKNIDNKNGSALIKTTDPTPVHIHSPRNEQSHVEKIKRDISSFPEIYDVAVIKGKKDTLVAYKVKHLHRFKMKAIEKKMNKRLEKKYPKENFTVSSDYKIFLEAVRLKEKMKSKDFSDKKAEKLLNEIIKMTKDMA
jgi:hypothetical protein